MKATRTRLLFIILPVLFIIAITILAIFVIRVNQRMNSLVLESNTSNAENTARLILQHREDNLHKLVYDYTFWDELVTYVGRKDEKWALVSLDPVVKNFELDALWVFNMRQNRVYFKTEGSYATLQNYKIPAELFNQLNKNHFAHYFDYSAHGLIEIEAASIHPSGDEQRIGEPQGYFVVGRVWNEAMRTKLADEFGAEIAFSKNEFVADEESWQIRFSNELRGIDGVPAAWLCVSKEYKKLEDYREASNLLIIHIILAALLTGGFVFWAYWLLVRKPLRLIKDALSAGSETATMALAKFGGRFLQISHLIGKNIADGKALEARIERANFSLQNHITGVQDISEQIRKPLTGIIGFSGLLSLQDLDEEKKDLYIRQVSVNSMDLLRVVDTGLSRISGNDPQLYYSNNEQAGTGVSYQEARMQLSKRRPSLVLVAEQPVNLLFLQETLAIEGVSLRYFSNPELAEHFLSEQGVSTLILDLSGMEDSNGEPIGLLKKMKEDLPLIVISEKSSAGMRKRYAEFGADDFIALPCTPGALLEVVLRNLGIGNED